jgi:four helix bundle protein
MALRFEDLRVLQSAERVADDVWGIVIAWGAFAKDSVGQQMVRAGDSIGANIAEAYGRFHYGEKLQFLYYARGSLFETKYWLNRGQSRGLFNPNQYDQLSKSLSGLAHQLNTLAQATRKQKKTKKHSKKIAEDKPEYHLPDKNPGETTSSDEDTDLFSPEDITFLESQPFEQIT